MRTLHEHRQGLRRTYIGGTYVECTEVSPIRAPAHTVRPYVAVAPHPPSELTRTAASPRVFTDKVLVLLGALRALGRCKSVQQSRIIISTPAGGANNDS